MNHAIFVDPSPALEALVRERKSLGGRFWPEAHYLSHPVHCTLLAGTYADPAGWVPALSEALRALPPFEIVCSAPFVFANDPATGGSTVVIGVEPSPELSALQLAVAEIVGPFRDIALAERVAQQVTIPAAAESARRYGAMWVGPHWRPHFTVGSFPVAADAPALQPLLQGFTPKRVPVTRVSVWDISGERHTVRAELPLGGGSVR